MQASAPVQNSTPNPAHLGLVAYDSLGDGLVYLMIAQNLLRNGYKVTYYGNLVSQLKSWLPQLEVKPYPDKGKLEQELNNYDLVVFCPPSFIRHTATQDELERLCKKYLFVCMKAPDWWAFDHTENIRQNARPEIMEKLLPLAQSSGRLRFRKFGSESVVEMILAYLREKMHLSQVSKDVDFAFPENLEHRKHIKRIIISPDSAGPEKKNWAAARFLKLANRLSQKGYDPKIVVAPANNDEWNQMPGNVYETPRFASIADLASYIYESGALIANDSGNGHLASILKVPTVTIYRKNNPEFAWRPDWGNGTVITPKITLNLLNKKIWHPFIPMKKIIRHIEQVCSLETSPL